MILTKAKNQGNKTETFSQMNITRQVVNGETHVISKQVGIIRKKPTEALQLENTKESY